MIDIVKTKTCGIKECKVTLTDNGGIKREFILRAFRSGDEDGIIQCVREEHGDTYFKRFFYDSKALCEKAAGDEYIFFVAACHEETSDPKGIKDKIAGIEILRIFDKNGDDYIEPASQIIRKAYRGMGLSGALADYTFKVAKDLRPEALLSHVAMYHSHTQRVCEKNGMEPVAFEIGSFLTKALKNSYHLQDVSKYSAGTLCLPVEKRDAGNVYLPLELRDYCGMIYEALDVKFCLADSSPVFDEEELPERSVFEISYDNDINRYVTINTLLCGKNLYDEVSKITEEHIRGDANPDSFVYLLILDIDTPAFPKRYEAFKSMGFFFGGLFPLCGTHERAFLYKVGDLELRMETYCVTDKFDKVREWIMKYYKARTRGQI